jgi:hypothetical protein
VVVYACNPSYLSCTGRRIASSRPAQAKLVKLRLETQNIKSKGLGAWLQYCKREGGREGREEGRREWGGERRKGGNKSRLGKTTQMT